MNVLIVGYGYVGSAVASIFKKKELTIIDPKISNKKIKDFKNKQFNVVFVCVNTPSNENFKTLDFVLKDLNDNIKPSTVVCCKSTALPSFYKKAEKNYKNIRLVYSPEYLSHHSNIKNFKSQTFCILGGDISACKTIFKILSPRLKKLKKPFYTTIDTASFVKYAVNAFFAYKISYFNEIYDIIKKLNISSSYNTIAKLIAQEPRVGTSHTQVPGRDGRRGWGGHCLPKDVEEFYKNTNSFLLKTLIKQNKIHRKHKFI